MGAASEAFLQQLAERSFLTLWSYPNPYTDRGLAQRKEGKELCDLLVVFGDDVIIFSDKSCFFPDGGDEQQDWNRWYRRAVQKSAQQIYGAERWLQEFPERVYADKRCTIPLVAKIPPKNKLRIYRIVVALGASSRCRRHFNGGSGSLPISGGVRLDDSPMPGRPFYIGGDGKPGKFVHIFDDVSLSVVLKELDTAKDFIEYLKKKETLFMRCAVVATGEEDLLGHYLLTLGDHSRHDFFPVGNVPDLLFVDEAAYRSLISLPQYIASKRANGPSYVWDRLIEHFTDAWRSGKVEESVSSENLERALRLMASASRLVRRALGSRLIEALETSGGRIRYMGTADAYDPKLFYGTVIVPQPSDTSYESYRERRQNLMTIYGRSLKVRMPSLTQALIVGTESQGVGQGSSEDLLLMDFDDWSDALAEETRRQMKILGLGAEAQHFREHEFPTNLPPNREAARRLRQLKRLKEKAR